MRFAAISEHERQSKLIEEQKKQVQRLEARLQRVEHDLDISRRDANTVRQENGQLRSEMANMQNPSSTNSYHGPPPMVNHAHNYAVQPEQQQQQLPPLRNIPGPEVMNGVQYSHDPRTNGYRAPSDRF
jgi:septal ring factor EnvC (AmiA/AmiB activator)